jgi:hypothetical protein
VKVEKQGFQSAVESAIDVGINQVVRVDFSLKVSAASETVEVSTAPPLLQTETSSLGTIETEKRISDLPLNGRNFIQLAYLGPGANAGQTGSNVSGGVFENERANEAISANGLRVTNNNFLLSGVDSNEFGLGGTIVLPAPDAIAEFRTEENSMGAEFGGGGTDVSDANAVADGSLGGWELGTIITAQTGEAVPAVLSNDSTNTGNQIHNPYDFSFNKDVQASLGCSNPGHQALDCRYNQGAFPVPALAPGQTFATNWGRSPIGNLRGPNLVHFDFVMQKNFEIRESQQIQLRAEFFNIFNHPNFGLPGGRSTSPADVQRGAAITNRVTTTGKSNSH